MKKTVTVNAGAWSKKFDAELNTDVCDRYNNAEITVIAKIFLKQGNPAGTAATGTANDANGNSKDVIRWSSAAWNEWKKSFNWLAMKYSGKFWLINNSSWNKFTDRGVDYLPNIWCRLKMNFTASQASAHHTITVYRVPKSGQDFRSNFSTMDSHDIHLQKKKTDSAGKDIKQRPAIHELFHTLGVRHVDHGETNCPLTDSGNAGTCYGNTDDEKKTLMGSGMALNAKFADPWRRAAVALTSTGSVASGTDWKSELQRHYPRTVEEAGRNAVVKRKPNRK